MYCRCVRTQHERTYCGVEDLGFCDLLVLLYRYELACATSCLASFPTQGKENLTVTCMIWQTFDMCKDVDIRTSQNLYTCELCRKM